jgi:hypothetical protein
MGPQKQVFVEVRILENSQDLHRDLWLAIHVLSRCQESLKEGKKDFCTVYG